MGKKKWHQRSSRIRETLSEKAASILGRASPSRSLKQQKKEERKALREQRRLDEEQKKLERINAPAVLFISSGIVGMYEQDAENIQHHTDIRL